MSTFEPAEAHLARREINLALTAYASTDQQVDPDRLSAGRWMCHMLAGDYAQAWLESDAIRRRSAPDAHRFWQGEPIDGKRLMVRCLHGYGDTVMYLRWLPLLNERAGEVSVQAAPEMLPLLRCMPDAKRVLGWTAQGESDREHWDVQIESAEMPYLFRTSALTLPSPVRLRFPEAEMHRLRLQARLRTKPRVGVVWMGSSYDAARSVPFEQFRTILSTHAVEFWSLQAPADNGDWVRFCTEQGWSTRTFYSRDDSENTVWQAGIAEMAAFASELDLVITVDTMAAHVAGSLGVPTWLMLKREADWRWMLDRDDTPWYPAMTLFRQTVSGDWSGVLQCVCDRLRDWCEEQGT